MTVLPIVDGSGRIGRFRFDAHEDVRVGDLVVVSSIATRYRVTELFLNEGGRAMSRLLEQGVEHPVTLTFPADRLTRVPVGLWAWKVAGWSFGAISVVCALLAVLLAGWALLS